MVLLFYVAIVKEGGIYTGCNKRHFQEERTTYS